jgi:MFS family permease
MEAGPSGHNAVVSVRTPRALLEPLRVPGFRPLAFAYTVNELGNWLGDVALALLVYDHTGSALATALLFVATRFLPALLSPLLVARVESGRLRLVLPSIYAAEAVAFALLAILAQDFVLAPLAALAVVDGALALSGRALVRASVVALLKPKGMLRAGNAVLNIGFTAAAAAGPLAAAGAVAALGVPAALMIDAGSFLLAAVALAAARSLPNSLAADDGPRRLAARVRDGLAYVRRNGALTVVLAGQGAAFIFFSAVIPVEVVFAKATLGAGDVGYGTMLSAWGVGMLIGGSLFAVARTVQLRWLVVAGTLAIAAAYLGVAAAPSLLVACLASAVGGIGNGVQWIALVSWLQELTEERYQARVMALFESVAALMPGIGFIAGGALSDLLSPRISFLVAGVGVLVVLVGAGVLLNRIGPKPGDPGAARPRRFIRRRGDTRSTLAPPPVLK